MKVPDPFRMLHGLYSAQVLFQLHRSGALEQLAEGVPASKVANCLGYDREPFRALLEFVCRTSDVLIHEPPETYLLNAAYRSYSSFGFHLDKFLGAYGSLLHRIDDALCFRGARQGLVDCETLAAAFRRANETAFSPLAPLLCEWGVNSLMDLGCGTGGLLHELCRLHPDFHGWGIDRNPAMCRAATERLQAAGYGEKARVMCGDVRVVAELLSAQEREEVGSLYGQSLLNEFFQDGPEQAVTLLRLLAETFPRRHMFVVDYYGRLSQPSASDNEYQAILQDVVQALSGQGIPPMDLPGWAQVYQTAGCRLVRACEGSGPGLDWFIHEIEL
jgi:hypothetical protein